MNNANKNTGTQRLFGLAIAVMIAGSAVAIAGTPPRTTGNVQVMSAWTAGLSKNQAGALMRDGESNLLLNYASSLGFGVGRPASGNFVSDWPQRDLIIQPGNGTDAVLGVTVNFVVTYQGHTVSRKVKIYEHAIRGTANGATAKLNLGQDCPSGRWARTLVVQKPDGTKDEYRVWKGRVIKADPKKLQASDEQSLITAASATKTTFLVNTLVPLSQACSAFAADRSLLSTTHAVINAVRRGAAIYDAPMRDADFFNSLVSQSPDVGFLRIAARDDVKASASDVKDVSSDWAKKAVAWADKIKKWIDIINKAVSVIVAVIGWL